MSLIVPSLFSAAAFPERIHIYSGTTMGRKCAAVFFLRVFWPFFGEPLPFKATNICLPLFFHCNEAYVLYPFSSILSFSLQSTPNSFFKRKKKKIHIWIHMISTVCSHQWHRYCQNSESLFWVTVSLLELYTDGQCWKNSYTNTNIIINSTVMEPLLVLAGLIFVHQLKQTGTVNVNVMICNNLSYL